METRGELGGANAGANVNAPIFEPLQLSAALVMKNRIFRSNISGRFDNYDGSGGYARINWEEKFARGGVDAIISSYTPVHVRGRIMVHYAMIDHDDKIEFWRQLGERVHQYGCKFIMQLSHSGRQQDQGGVENEYQFAQSSTSTPDTFHGIVCKAMTREEIKETVGHFAAGALRAKRAGLVGVELHGANGYLITQFLSSAINDGKDEYDGAPQNRYRFVTEIIHAVRQKVGDGFHLQLKLSAVNHGNALYSGRREATPSMNPSKSASGPRRMESTPFTFPRATRFRIRPTRLAAGPSSRQRDGMTRCSRKESTPGGFIFC
jgi:2,4-dienoyl-CoA reductase-like NADH-dependent reductase (Old Yellow Enzyme family)